MGGYPRVPDIVGKDEDDRAFLVAAGTGVPQDHGRRDPAPLDLVPENLEKLAPALLAAAALPRGCADKDLAKSGHGEILRRAGEKSNGGFRLQVSWAKLLSAYEGVPEASMG